MRAIGPIAISAIIAATLALAFAVHALAEPAGTAYAGFPIWTISVICALTGFAEKNGAGRPFLLLALCIDMLTALLLGINLLRNMPM